MNDLEIHDAAILYCTFWVGGRWFGVAAQDVREVHALPELTPVPGAPATVAGYVNLRGQLFLVLNATEVLLSGASHGDASAARLVLFRASAGESFAVLLDALGDIVEVASEHIDNTSQREQASERERLTLGHARLERGMLTLIDARRLLAAAFGNPSATSEHVTKHRPV